MSEKIKDVTLTQRAFDCVEKNDTLGLLQCCDEGFDVNTLRRTKIISMWASYLEKDDRYEETVSSLALKNALRNHDWSIPKTLIERYGVDHLVLADSILSDPQERVKQSAISPATDKWPDLGQKTFESSPAHFCLWHICRPGSPDKSIKSSILEGFFLKELLDNPQREDGLHLFFRACAALEQKYALSQNLSTMKEEKPTKQKPYL